MFISVFDLFKIGIGPSSSHTMGPMMAAVMFRQKISDFLGNVTDKPNTMHLRCVLKGSLAYTGRGHCTDHAVILGLHGHTPESLINTDIDELVQGLQSRSTLAIDDQEIAFNPTDDIEFDCGDPLPEHPNGLIFQLLEGQNLIVSETYFSIGGGFIHTLAEMKGNQTSPNEHIYPYPFDSSKSMLEMAERSGLSIAEMKRANEEIKCKHSLDQRLNDIWKAMKSCVLSGLGCEGVLPGSLKVARRAKGLHQQILTASADVTLNDWLCAYAMAVNEENAAGHMVVTAPTNGAAGVIPAVLYFAVKHQGIEAHKIHDYLLTAAAIGGIIKHRSSISGAEVGCQGEVGSAAAMAAAGLCAVMGGSPRQVENAAEIALEHHLGMTCDPVAGLVQIPCIERNGFGAIKAFTAASLAKRGSGQHFMPLDNCIAAMKQTGLEMSTKYKETSLGGLAVNFTEC